jgi:hypothetical protein
MAAQRAFELGTKTFPCHDNQLAFDKENFKTVDISKVFTLLFKSKYVTKETHTSTYTLRSYSVKDINTNKLASYKFEKANIKLYHIKFLVPSKLIMFL